MAKYFLASIIFFCFAPLAALAAHDTVTFSQDTDVYLSGIPLTLVIVQGGEVAK